MTTYNSASEKPFESSEEALEFAQGYIYRTALRLSIIEETLKSQGMGGIEWMFLGDFDRWSKEKIEEWEKDCLPVGYYKIKALQS